MLHFLHKARWTSCFVTLLVVAAGCSSSDVSRTPDSELDLSMTDVSMSDAGVDTADAESPTDVRPDTESQPDLAETLSKSSVHEMVECERPRASQRVERFERDIDFELPDLSGQNVEGSNYDFPLGDPLTASGAIAMKLNVAPPVQSVSGKGAFASPGEDLKVQVGLKAGNPDFESVFVAVLVDYRSVDAEFVRLAPDRAEVLDSEVTSQKRYPIDDEYRGVLLDITIPADVFEEERMYDISVIGTYTRPHELYGIRERDIKDIITLFYGGFDVPEHPCFDPGEYSNVDTNSFEYDALPFIGHSARFVPDGVETVEALEAPIELEPGAQTLTGQLFIYGAGATGRARGRVFVPYINDKPWVEGSQWLLVPALPGIFVDTIDVEIPIPNAPGEHPVVYKEWDMPFVPRITLEAEKDLEVRSGAPMYGVQPFIVTRP